MWRWTVHRSIRPPKSTIEGRPSEISRQSLVCHHQQLWTLLAALRILRIGERGQSLVLPCDGSAFRDQEGMVRWEQVEETVVLLRGGETSVAESLRVSTALPLLWTFSFCGCSEINRTSGVFKVLNVTFWTQPNRKNEKRGGRLPSFHLDLYKRLKRSF